MKRFEGFQKGVNLGGWISQFAYYDEEHFNTFITEQDIAEIASLGFDHVRVPVDYNVLEDEEGKTKESGFAYLLNCYSWCEKHGLNMLVDLHECYGYSFDPLKKNMDRERFFYDEALQTRFLRLWERIAKAFADKQHVAFEPLNEVVLPSVKDAWNALVRRYIEMIRAIAPDVYIVIGGVNYNNVLSVPLLDPPYDDKIVFNFHCYEPMIFTHQGAYWMEQFPRDYRIQYPCTVEHYRAEHLKILKEENGPLFLNNVHEMGPEFFEVIFDEALRTSEKYDVALYCGEYGAIDLADSRSKINWLRDIHAAFNRHGIGRALWNYKEKDFGFEDEAFQSIRDDFITII